jgi:alpha-tubulin suppressor-like RCC1 family protein
MRFELLPALSDAQGRQLSPALYTLSWASDLPAVATVDAAGEVTAVGGGTATISLTVDGMEATSQVIVSDMPGVEVDRVVITGLTEPTLLPGESLTLSAQALDRAGAPVAGAQIVWSSTQRAVATIDAAGRVAALAEGTTALVASAGGAMAQVTLDVTLDADSVSAGGRHACALVDGRAFCWGDNTRGQLGRGAVGATGAPARAEAGRRFVQIIAGGEHTCGVDEAGRRAVCWGRGDSGQLGQGSQADAGAAQDTGLTRVNALCAGARHTCAIGGEGQVYCWGDNAAGQLGIAGGARSAPTLVDATHQWAAIACGRSHTCAALATGEVRCWGDNSRGQIGDQTTTPRPRPTPLVGAFEMGVLKAGAQHTCGITSNGTPLCWGANSAGQLGEGTMLDRTAPTFLSAPGLQITALDAGESHACALAMGGSVYCWGAASAGQLGGASAVNTSVPARVVTAPAAVLVAVGGDTSYIVDVTGDVWGWGAASAGQLGAGQTGSVAMPVRVFGP